MIQSHIVKSFYLNNFFYFVTIPSASISHHASHIWCGWQRASSFWTHHLWFQKNYLSGPCHVDQHKYWSMCTLDDAQSRIYEI